MSGSYFQNVTGRHRDKYMPLRNSKNTCRLDPYLAMSGRVSLLGMDKARKQNWISNEKNRGVVSNHIPVSFLGVELDGESNIDESAIRWGEEGQKSIVFFTLPSWVPHSVCTAAFSTHG